VMLYQLLVGDLRRPMAPGWEHELDDSLLLADITAASAGDVRRRIGSVAELTVRLRTLEERRAVKAEVDRSHAEAESLQRALERARARRPWVVAVMLLLALGLATTLLLYRGERHAALESERAVARLGILQYETGHFEEAVETLSGVHAELATRSGADSPEAQATAYYLASALVKLREYAPAARLAGILQSSELAHAEPRADWLQRLEQLRAAIENGMC
jgi:hypothetical protein